jgi:hypothetical protein
MSEPVYTCWLILDGNREDGSLPYKATSDDTDPDEGDGFLRFDPPPPPSPRPPDEAAAILLSCFVDIPMSATQFQSENVKRKQRQTETHR